MSATSWISGRYSLTPSKSLFSVSSDSPAKSLCAIPILLKSDPNFSRHSRSYAMRSLHRSSCGAFTALAAVLPASIPEYPPIMIPPPVVCLTWLAASPTTRKFSDQHLSMGPDTRTEPDFSVQLDARSNGAVRQVLVEPSPVYYHRYRLLLPKLERLPFRRMEDSALDSPLGKHRLWFYSEH